MEQKIVPTSPKSEIKQVRDKNKKKEHRNAQPHVLFIATVIALLLGSVAGFFGFLIASNLPTDLPVFGQFNVVSVLEEQKQDVLLSTRRSENSVLQQAPAVIDQIVSIYSAEPTIDNINTFLGNAVAVTSDGWLMMESSIAPQIEVGGSTTAVAVLADGSVAELLSTVQDSLAGVTFIKVETSNHPVVSINAKSIIGIGRSLSVIEKRLGTYMVYERRVAGPENNNSTTRSTQVLSDRMILDFEQGVNHVGSPVFHSNGNLAGILLDNGVLANSHILNGALKSLIKDGDIERSAVNVEYINVSRLTDAVKEEKNIPDSGLYIIDTVNDASDDTLLAGDVIMSINNEFVTQETDLASVLHSQPMGTIFYITVMRNGAEVFIEFTS